MDQPHCADCLFFCQHYIFWFGNFFLPVEYGHCIYARTKIRRPMQSACEHFRPRNMPL